MHNWLDFTLPQLRKMLENSIEAALGNRRTKSHLEKRMA